MRLTLVLLTLIFCVPTLRAEEADTEKAVKRKKPPKVVEEVKPPGPAIHFPLGRTAYQTNEWIDVCFVRYGLDELPAGTLDVNLESADGSLLTTSFPTASVPKRSIDAQRTEHLRLNGFLLRPGHYTLTMKCDGTVRAVEFDICSHIRKTTFRIIDWGGSGHGREQVRCGEDGTGVNLMMGGVAGHDQSANILGGMDYMRNCSMGGAHQMDGKQDYDWSDPCVMFGGMARAARQALKDRTSPNVLGVHFYDEPGLTWNKHPKTGLFSPHNIASQDWAFKAATGRDALQYCDVDPKDPAQCQAWDAWMRWKQVFMESAWRLSRFSVEWVQPQMLSATQSMYGWLAFGDGYYFNVTRSLAVNSGHGGYDDLAGGFLAPGFFYEFGRTRDYAKPQWYLPQWWDDVPASTCLVEQYLTFMTGVQGIAVPPGYRSEAPGLRTQDSSVLESNRLMARVGTIFTTMPLTRPDVAVLYSMSQNARNNLDSQDFFLVQDFPGQIEKLLMVYTASKMAHIPLFPVVEEDILDGTVAANHKAIVLTGIDTLDAKVLGALKAYITGGGRVILTDDCKIDIPGSTRLGAEAHTRLYEAAQQAIKDTGINPLLRRVVGCIARNAGAYYREGAPIAAALAERCREIGVAPIVDCSNPSVFATRHAQGDVEYFFLLNASTPEKFDPNNGVWNTVLPAQAKVAFPDNGRPLYDAVTGGPAAEFEKNGNALAAELRFGAGQLRVFARTPRPIGSVQVLNPVVRTGDYAFTQKMPITLELQALVLDDAGRALSGAIPLAIQVVDPLGGVRYDLQRATENGLLKLILPLAANDPAGAWKVSVRELLANHSGTASFTTRAVTQCSAAVGAPRRAVYFPADDENIFRFFRNRHNLALVYGPEDFDKAQAERLAENLKRWGATCKLIPAAELKKKERPSEYVKYWAGARGHPDLDMPGDGAIILGSPERVPLLANMNPTPKNFTAVLPYLAAGSLFPGRGRGMLAWQTDSTAFGNYESIVCIADDAEGMAEAVGTLFEIASGYRHATDVILPENVAIKPAAKATDAVAACPASALPGLGDKVLALQPLADGSLLELSRDGKLRRLNKDGQPVWQQMLLPAEMYQLAANPDGNTIAVAATRSLLVYDGAGQLLFSTPLAFNDPRLKSIREQAALSVAVSPDGSRIAAGAGAGNLLLVTRKGEVLYSGGGATEEEFAKYVELKKASDAIKLERAPAEKQFKEALAKWQAADAEWNKAAPDKRGERPVKPKPLPKAPKPPVYAAHDACRAVHFSADGKLLLALYGSQGALFNAVSGSKIVELPELAGRCAAQDGSGFLAVTDAFGIVQIASDGTLSEPVTVPAAGPAAEIHKPGVIPYAPDAIVGVWRRGGSLIVANYLESAVRSVIPPAPDAELHIEWTVTVPDRVTKFAVIRENCIALACWGGTLRLVDSAKGSVIAQQKFDQDISAMAWWNGKLIVGLADGQRWLLTIP